MPASVEVTAYPNVHGLLGRIDWTDPTPSPSLLVPCELLLGTIELSMFTAFTNFGSPRDVTLDELAVELFDPTNDATEQALLALSDNPINGPTVVLPSGIDSHGR